MKYPRKIFILISISFIVIAIILLSTVDSIHSRPADFTTTSNQREPYYPSSWRFSSGFTTSWEYSHSDALYDYYARSTSHSYSFQWSFTLLPNNYVEIYMQAVNHDDNGHGAWLFELEVLDINRNIVFYSSPDFLATTTITIPEQKGYGFTLSAYYLYWGCTSYYEDTCFDDDILLYDRTHTFEVDIEEYVWEDIHEGFKQFWHVVIYLAIFVPYIIEYGINFKDRKTIYSAIFGVVLGGLAGLGIYQIILVTQASSNNAASGLGFTGLNTNGAYMIIAVIVYWTLYFVEWRMGGTKEKKAEKFQTSGYQKYTPTLYQQQSTQTSNNIFQQQTSPTPVRTLDYCINCGDEIEQNANFCTTCGAKV